LKIAGVSPPEPIITVGDKVWAWERSSALVPESSSKIAITMYYDRLRLIQKVIFKKSPVGEK
jgi:hypothetical protein